MMTFVSIVVRNVSMNSYNIIWCKFWATIFRWFRKNPIRIILFFCLVEKLDSLMEWKWIQGFLRTNHTAKKKNHKTTKEIPNQCRVFSTVLRLTILFKYFPTYFYGFLLTCDCSIWMKRQMECFRLLFRYSRLNGTYTFA